MSFILVGTGLAVAGAALGAHSANKAKKEAEKKEAAAAEEMNRLKNIYADLDTSNPFANMESMMEDLTINQRAVELENLMYQQSQANILGGLGQASGQAGISSVAQSLVNQGKLQAQQLASDIGFQERANEISHRNELANLQSLERQGDIWSRNAERDKQATLLGMQQQEVGAAREQIAAAEQAKWDSISGGIESIGGMLTQPFR
tara:strand:+ start:383 stop:997 length:615 start_codon:yes stop_codon:yes gene_type:complete